MSASSAFFIRALNSCGILGSLLQILSSPSLAAPTTQIPASACVSARLKALLTEDATPPIGKLEFFEQGSGSNGGAWYRDHEGGRWFVKKDLRHSELQTSAEVISSRIYKELGYVTPDAYIVELEGKRAVAIRELPGSGRPSTLSDQTSPEFRQMHVVSAYLNDWDRLQYGPNNFDYGDHGFALFDFGGTLGARARGEHKPGPVFSGAIGSFEATDDFDRIYGTFKVDSLSERHFWKQLTVNDMKALIAKFDSLSDSRLEQIVKAARYSDTRDAGYMLSALKARRKGIIEGLAARIAMEKRAVIDEIVALPEFSTIPAALAEEDPELIARALNQRIENFRSRNPSAFQKSFGGEPARFADQAIGLFFEPKLIPRILSEGVLNIHQLADSTKIRPPRERFFVEDQMVRLRIPDDPRWNSLRPKSALMLPLRSEESRFLDESAISFYGKAIAVLKPEVRSRSTWTAKDSVYYLMPNLTRRNPGEEFAAATFSEPQRSSGSYVEVQVWGPLNPENIKEVWVPESFDPRSLPKTRPSIPIRAYSLKRGESGGVYLEPGRWLVPPELKNADVKPQKIELPAD